MSYEPLWDHGARWDSVNASTICFDPTRSARQHLPAAELFLCHFPTLRFLREAHALDGYLVVPIYDRATLGPYAHLPEASDPRASTLVVGRHTMATLRLDRDPTVALRHVAVRVRRGEQGQPAVRLIDLNTGQGFELDGLGRCETAICDGPLIARVGSYTLFFLPTTADQEPWSTDPKTVWHSAPRTIVTDLRQLARLPAAHLVQQRETTLVLLPGPISLDVQAPVVASGPLVGRLTLRDCGSVFERPVYRDELERGLLIGRYERCALRPIDHEVKSQVSRVHLLLTVEGSEVLVVDTASTNGTACDGSPLVAATLPDHAELLLAEILTVDWLRAGTDPSRPQPPSPGPPTPADPPPDDEPRRATPPPLEVVWSAAARPAPEAAAAPAPRAAQWLAGALPRELGRRLGRVRDRVLARARAIDGKLLAAVVTGAVVGLMVVRLLVGVLLPHAPDADPPLVPPPTEPCLDPSALFGADTPELRLYLYDRVPGVCFTEKWTPRSLQEEEPEEEAGEEPLD